MFCLKYVHLLEQLEQCVYTMVPFFEKYYGSIFRKVYIPYQTVFLLVEQRIHMVAFPHAVCIAFRQPIYSPERERERDRERELVSSHLH